MAPPIFCSASSWALRRASFIAAEHHLAEDLGVLGIERRGVDPDLADLQVAAHLHEHRAAARGGLDDLLAQLLLGELHVLLHLLDLGHHLLHVGPLRGCLGISALRSLVPSAPRGPAASGLAIGQPVAGDLLGVELVDEALHELVLGELLGVASALVAGDVAQLVGQPPAARRQRAQSLADDRAVGGVLGLLA